jgi:hypothetical protein
MNGKPNRTNGCLAKAARYRAAIEFDCVEVRNFLLEKTAMIVCEGPLTRAPLSRLVRSALPLSVP